MFQPHPIYDDERRWADAGIFAAPLFDAPSFQKRIDKITGVSPSGHSIVRLSWAWTCRKWENTAWDSFGVATEGEWRQRYRALTVEIGNDDYVDISPPRWVLEERFEPQAIAVSWEATRYRTVITESVPADCRHCHRFGGYVPLDAVPTAWLDISKCKDGKMWLNWWHPDLSDGQFITCRYCGEDTVLTSVRQDVWGEVPREGWYTMLPNRGMGIIAQHRNNCCAKAKDLGEICWGFYKEPGALELKRLRKAIHLRNREMETNPHIRPELNENALQQAKMWGLQMMKDIEVRRRGELAEIHREHKPNNNIVYST